MKTVKHKATSAPIDPEDYTPWSDRTSMTRANIGRTAVDMLPYWNPDDDYDKDPRTINPLACMNLAVIAIDGQEIGKALEEGAATEDGVLIVGALAVAGWQVSHFRERVAPQLKALRDYHPEWLVQGAYRQDGQVDWMPDADASFGALCTQLLDAAKEAYAGYKSEDEARFRRAFKLIEKQCERLPELLKERLETYYYHRIDTYQFPEVFTAAFGQLYEPATAEAEAAEVSAYN